MLTVDAGNNGMRRRRSRKPMRMLEKSMISGPMPFFLMKLDFGDYLCAYRLVERLDELGAHKRQFAFQRCGGDIQVEHPAVNEATCRIAVDTGTDDLRPQVEHPLFVELRFDAVGHQFLLYYVGKQLRFGASHCYR